LLAVDRDFARYSAPSSLEARLLTCLRPIASTWRSLTLPERRGEPRLQAATPRIMAIAGAGVTSGWRQPRLRLRSTARYTLSASVGF